MRRGGAAGVLLSRMCFMTVCACAEVLVCCVCVFVVSVLACVLACGLGFLLACMFFVRVGLFVGLMCV